MKKHTELIKGFSRMDKDEKKRLIGETYSSSSQHTIQTLDLYTHPDATVQKTHDSFAENTLSNYYLPYGIAPNVMINGHVYAVPMVIEESSVVAAASKAASYWAARGGFKCEISGVEKKGQIHLYYHGDSKVFAAFFAEVKESLLEACLPITAKMTARGGGILSLSLRDLNHIEPDYYQIDLSADTMDSMGANFINSTLECIASELKRLFAEKKTEGTLEVIMCILSNYTPQCLSHVEVSCPVSDMKYGDMDGEEFCSRFVRAVKMAELCVERAVTHNKGIMNGIDAVVLSTGNDFRAIEACAHAYAARNGQYSSLSHAEVKDGVFRFWMDIPLAMGTVGGLTKLHPLAALSMDILGKPSARELMMICASVGLAQNFGAVSSLVTSGIQSGHMKMHLNNILLSLGANDDEISAAKEHFKKHTVSHSAVEDFLNKMR